MKKIFLVLSFFMALTLIAAPSYALIGIDDPVPGTDFIVPFVVAMGTTGLDTAIVVQEISDLAGFTALAPGQFHWYIYTSASVERIDYIQSYTGGDVVPLSIRLLLNAYATAADLTALEYDLDGDGINDHYVGYFYGESTAATVARATDNLYVTFLYVDLAAGKASGSYAAMKEFTGAATAVATTNANGYKYEQFANALNTATEAAAFPAAAAAGTTGTTLEPFSPAAYFYSAWKERGRTDAAVDILAAAGNLNYIEFTPRWYLHNADAETYIFVWKNRNHNQTGVASNITIFCWDEIETRVSKTISLPLQLNILRVRDFLPPTMYATYPAGGWVSIRIADANPGFTSGYLQNWRYTDFLIYTWTYAADATAGLNWAALWNDRKVGTLGVAPVG